MVVNIDPSYSDDCFPAGSAPPLRRTPSLRRPQRAGQCLTIGLLNNMAGAAFKATERQFLSLLAAASEGIPIHVSFFTLPGLKRTESGGQQFASHYSSVEALMDTHLDGLIVTGREPKMADLRDEPYWESFTRVLEWARNNTYSTVWSCLAAHAAILYMDGIHRRKSEKKNFGVFECELDSEHPLNRGLPSRFHIPHSRWNGIARKDLTIHGYSVLARLAGEGVDTFVKDVKSLFVFFQGHPEYGSDTLMREYRGDVGRYVKGETKIYPSLPSSYFDRNAESALTIIRDKASLFGEPDLLPSVSAALENTKIENKWESSATRIYRNWLECISARKSEGNGAHHAGALLSVSR